MVSVPAADPADVRPGDAGARRYASLDGLRGVAALVVVLQHAMLVVPALEAARDGGAEVGSPGWWVTNTPLRFFWAGDEAVLLFFVLSGFVLALPATRGPIAWAAYYPRRLVRLYLPVWGSLLLAVALVVLLPREAEPGRTAYLDDRIGVSPRDAPGDALLLGGEQLLNSPLWSLKWEVLFSLLLPLYLLLPRLLGARPGRPLGTGAFLASSVGVLGLLAVGASLRNGWLYFLPLFAIGVLLAYAQPTLAAWADRVERLPRPGLGWAGLAVLAVVLVTAQWTVEGLPGVPRALDVAATAGPFAGAALALFVALHAPAARRALSRGVWHTLGVLSFSLYLVHEPVIVTVALLFPVTVSPWVPALLGVPLALAASAGFRRAVEAPAHRLSRNVGSAVLERQRRRRERRRGDRSDQSAPPAPPVGLPERAVEPLPSPRRRAAPRGARVGAATARPGPGRRRS